VHTKRESCRLCLSPDLKQVVQLLPVPVGEKYADSKEKVAESVRYPVDLYWCESCGCVQTLDDLDPDFLWSDYTYLSGQTQGIVDHFNEFAHAAIDKYALCAEQLVMDIGSNDGTLLRAFKEKGMRVAGVDPATELAQQATTNGIPTLPECFSELSAQKVLDEHGKASFISAFNVFAHSADMVGMIKGIDLLLEGEGVFAFEVQYLMDILDKKLLGTIFHEHMIHHSLSSLSKFFATYGMKLVDVERVNIQKGSIIGYVARDGSKWERQQAVTDLLQLEDERKLTEFSTVHTMELWLREQRKRVESLKQEWKQADLTVCGYGAARSGPTLAIQLGLEHVMSYLLDNHSMKVGKFAPFEALEVRPTATLSAQEQDVVVVLAWIHTKGIIRQHLDYLEEGGQFLALYPEVTLIDKSNVESFIGSQ